MNILLVLIWFVAFIIALAFVFHYLGFSALTDMFPEGKRWWHAPAQFAALAFYTALVVYNPWRWG